MLGNIKGNTLDIKDISSMVLGDLIGKHLKLKFPVFFMLGDLELSRV